jgi:hypothetical protein
VRRSWQQQQQRQQQKQHSMQMQLQVPQMLRLLAAELQPSTYQQQQGQ